MDSRQDPSEDSSRPVKGHSGLEGTHESRVGQVSSVASCRSIPTAIRTPNYRRRRRGAQRATSTFHASVTHSAHVRARARARSCVCVYTPVRFISGVCHRPCSQRRKLLRVLNTCGHHFPFALRRRDAWEPRISLCHLSEESQAFNCSWNFHVGMSPRLFQDFYNIYSSTWVNSLGKNILAISDSRYY